jgi:CHAT domain-containing protein
LEEIVLRFLSLCTNPSSDLNSLNTEGWRLYGILIAPLESDIRGAVALRIETDGILDKIPFDLLRGPEGYLGDHFEVTFSQGAGYGLHANSQFKREPLSSASAALIVVASGAPKSSLPMLPEALDEGEEVASQFKAATLISGRGIRRAELLSNLRNAEVFHFAGHAVAAANRVGLVLGPEALLSYREVEAARPRHLRLAVLSACDTANGDQGTFTDVNSVARALAATGVPQVVASRWSVDSTVTRRFMREFYSHLIAGKSTTDSLRAATIAIRSLPEYRHPYFWASFAVFGSS